MTESVTTAVVDADVLYQRYPRNLVMWLAVEGVFSVASSEVILGEVNRHLRQRNSKVHGDERADKVERSIDLIRDAIGAGAGHLASTDEVGDLIESVQAPDPDDRHVVAAALAVEANCIVTHNLTDFDAEWCAERGIGLLGLDDFLADLVGVSEAQDAAIAAATINYAKYPPNSIEELLAIIEDFAPQFASAVADLV